MIEKMDETPVSLDFTEILTALKDLSRPFPGKLLRGFSDLSPLKLKKLLPVWVDLPTARKVNLLEDLEVILEKDTIVNFDELAKAVLSDVDAAVRVLAIRLLWECEDTTLVPTLIEMLFEDPDEAVRAGTANLLGRFVYLGELDLIPDTHKISIVRNLLDVLDGEDFPQVKQRALESLGYASHPKVPELIQIALDSGDILFVSAALCAIGHTADDTWEPVVLEYIGSPDYELQYEAVRAAGELELVSAIDLLIAMLDEDEVDPDIRLAAIWSLSQIGGDTVRDTLSALLESSEDDEEIELVESALDNMDTGGERQNLKMLDYDPDEEDDGEFSDDEYSDEEFLEDEEDELEEVL
jgi:HEAT repeat protein